LANLWHDLKHSLRSLFKNPGFTIAAVAALALGIGTNTAIFTVVNTVLLKPLNYPEPDRLVQFLNIDPDGSSHFASPTNFLNWKDQTSVFQDVAGIIAGFGLTRFLASFLYGVHSWDPLVFVTVPIILSAVALLAVWLPASRAARLEPLQALRSE